MLTFNTLTFFFFFLLYYQAPLFITGGTASLRIQLAAALFWLHRQNKSSSLEVEKLPSTTPPPPTPTLAHVMTISFCRFLVVRILTSSCQHAHSLNSVYSSLDFPDCISMPFGCPAAVKFIFFQWQAVHLMSRPSVRLYLVLLKLTRLIIPSMLPKL